MNRYTELEAKTVFLLAKSNKFHAWFEAAKECGLPYFIFALGEQNDPKMRALDTLTQLVEDEIGVTGDWSHKFNYMLSYGPLVRLCFANDTDQMLVKLALNVCYDNLADWQART